LPEGVKPYLLGGGNPARIPAVEKEYPRNGEASFHSDAFEDAIGKYDAPQGRVRFLETLAEFFSGSIWVEYRPRNIAITNGSQTAFFYLFNLFSGSAPERRTILFPLVPEYVGYADQGSIPIHS
jgi:valine--pyruvate aminotransferase